MRGKQKPVDQVFEAMADMFFVLSTPIRLKIIGAVCNGEKNVSELLEEIDTTQPNISRHLAMLHRTGILAKRREGTQVYYRIQSKRVADLCRTVCTQVASELEHNAHTKPAQRMVSAAYR